MSLKPIKRLEMILDGQDIEPATRLEYFLKKAAEGGGSGGLVEIKNVEPFQVPDLVNGGTRLYDPVNDSLYLVDEPGGNYSETQYGALISNVTPPGFVTLNLPVGSFSSITMGWMEETAYEDQAAENSPQFCVAPSTFYRLRTGDMDYYLFKPESIVYKYTTHK